METPTDELQKIGMALTALLKKRGLSQNKLASMAGVPQGTISRIARGAVSYEISSLMLVLRALGITLDELAILAGLSTRVQGKQRLHVEFDIDVRGALYALDGKAYKVELDE